jgi:hypothetical protein
MFCASGLVFGGNEVVGARFHDSRAQTRFRRYRGRRVPFSCFARPNSFSTVPRASCHVFIFCAPELIFDGTEAVGSQTRFRRYRASNPDFMFRFPGLVFGGIGVLGSRFHVLRSINRSRRYRGSSVPFSCFALPDSLSVVTRASGPVFMICAPELIFDGTEGVVSRFHVLRARTHFRRYRGRRVPFSCFVVPDSFSAVPRASNLDFMFCAPVLVFAVSGC